MSDNKPARYKYYLLGNTRPIRIAYDARGLMMGAETPDMDGNLEKDATLMSRIGISWEVEDIDAETFERLCREFPATMRARLARLK